jgi:hypothetical protein
LINLFLLEGYSITIPYSTCIVFGAWLRFAGEAKWREVRQRGGKAERSLRQRGA